MSRYIRFLDEIGAEDLPLVGGKGANLGELTQAGLSVPPGFCLTAEAYRDFIASAGLQAPIAAILASPDMADPSNLEGPAARIRQLIASQPMPPEIANQVLAAYRSLAGQLGVGDGSVLPVAVRSSATAEDLPGASFAGQQDTYLHVRGEAALLERVAACWASLWTARALAYRTHQGFDHQQVHLAVVVQAMIDAELAGIMFTANPVNGSRDEMVINASWGLGEAIVSGMVTPDTVIVRKAGGTILSRHTATKELMIVSRPTGGTETVRIPAAQQDAEALSDAQVAGLVALGLQVESHYQAPEDIEWAYARGRFYLLQARPITGPQTAAQWAALSSPVPASGEYSRTMFVEIFPRALTPCFASVVKPLFDSVLRFTFQALGFTPPPDADGVAVIHGQPYFSRDYIAAALQPLSPRVRERLVTQIISPFGRHEQEMQAELSLAYLRMVRRMVRYLRHLPEELRGVLQRYQATILAAERLPLRAMSDEHIMAHMRRLALEEASEIVDYDFLMIALIGITYQMLGSLLKRYYGEEVEELRARLISGVTGNVTMETNKALWDLAQVAKASPVASRLLRTHDPAGVQAVLAEEPAAEDFLVDLDEFLACYGHREIRMDIIHPTWGEDPAPVFGFVRSYLDVDAAHSPHHQQARLVQERQALTAEVRARMRRDLKGRLLLPLFDWVLHQTQAHTRERDTIHFEVTRLFPPMRAMLGELGRRWAQAGVIDQPGDIYFLNLEQLTAMASAPAPAQEIVAANRAAYEADQSRRWPDVIRNGEEIWVSKGQRTVEGPAVEGQWHGVAGSPHVATGVARVVRGPEDFHCLGKGEVLVAPSTDPAWTPLFAVASAVVTEVGGILSHGAIVAREYGIPAVMGVRGITSAIHTGQVILVDGNRGTVQVAG